MYTVFFKDENEMPQDFSSYSEAEDYAIEKNVGEYVILSNDGEVV